MCGQSMHSHARKAYLHFYKDMYKQDDSRPDVTSADEVINESKLVESDSDAKARWKCTSKCKLDNI